MIFLKSEYAACLDCVCNQYQLSGQKWHIIYFQETIPVFMYELNMPKRPLLEITYLQPECEKKLTHGC